MGESVAEDDNAIDPFNQLRRKSRGSSSELIPVRLLPQLSLPPVFGPLKPRPILVDQPGSVSDLGPTRAIRVNPSGPEFFTRISLTCTN